LRLQRERPRSIERYGMTRQRGGPVGTSRAASAVKPQRRELASESATRNYISGVANRIAAEAVGPRRGTSYLSAVGFRRHGEIYCDAGPSAGQGPAVALCAGRAEITSDSACACGHSRRASPGHGPLPRGRIIGPTPWLSALDISSSRPRSFVISQRSIDRSRSRLAIANSSRCF
jgi:hypothetical protein